MVIKHCTYSDLTVEKNGEIVHLTYCGEFAIPQSCVDWVTFVNDQYSPRVVHCRSCWKNIDADV